MYAPRTPTGDRHIQVERERIVHGSKLLGKMCVLTRGSTTAFVPSRTTKSCAVDSSFATAGRQETAAPRRFGPSIGLSLTRCLWRNSRTPRTIRGIRRDLPALPSHAQEVPDPRLCVSAIQLVVKRAITSAGMYEYCGSHILRDRGP